MINPGAKRAWLCARGWRAARGGGAYLQGQRLTRIFYFLVRVAHAHEDATAPTLPELTHEFDACFAFTPSHKLSVSDDFWIWWSDRPYLTHASLRGLVSRFSSVL